MKVCVIGQGYIGLPTAILFAKNGCDVVGVDINKDIINSLNENKITIEEKGLQELFNEVNSINKYHASLKPEEADVFIITVPTPYNQGDYSCDLSYVLSACESILPIIKKENTIIIESTIAPLSMKKFIKPFFEKEGYEIGKDLFLAHCPERVLPGNLVYELINNNRIIGGITDKCAKKASSAYKQFVKGKIIETNSEVAEMSKCMENTFRDVNIALANELVKISSDIGVDALDVIKIANEHPRVNIHQPGPGVGGHCLAIDPYFIYALSPNEANLIKLSRDINQSMPTFVSTKCDLILKNHSNEKLTISIFGISYKGNSDDDRESPSYKIINILNKKYNTKIYDPHIPEKSMKFEESLKDSSLLLILTDHNEFKKLDQEKIIKYMKEPVIFDTKNVIDKEQLSEKIKLFNFGNIYSLN